MMTIVISAFPATGKTWLKENIKNKVILDSDSSKFSWLENGERNPDFPNNYIRYIRSNIGEVDLILISSHEVVRKTLVENGLFFVLVYPNTDLKSEYIQRFKDRGNDQNFIDFLSANWNNFITDMKDQYGCECIELQAGEYLNDIYYNKLWRTD